LQNAKATKITASTILQHGTTTQRCSAAKLPAAPHCNTTLQCCNTALQHCNKTLQCCNTAAPHGHTMFAYYSFCIFCCLCTLALQDVIWALASSPICHFCRSLQGNLFAGGLPTSHNRVGARWGTTASHECSIHPIDQRLNPKGHQDLSPGFHKWC